MMYKYFANEALLESPVKRAAYSRESGSGLVWRIFILN